MDLMKRLAQIYEEDTCDVSDKVATISNDMIDKYVGYIVKMIFCITTNLMMK